MTDPITGDPSALSLPSPFAPGLPAAPPMPGIRGPVSSSWRSRAQDVGIKPYDAGTPLVQSWRQQAWNEIMGPGQAPQREDFVGQTLADNEKRQEASLGRSHWNGFEYDPSPPPGGDMGFSEAPLPWDAVRLIKDGFNSTPLASFARYIDVGGAAHYRTDPNYNIFSDPLLRSGRYKDQWHLFLGSRSGEETLGIIRRMNEMQKEASYIERMGGSKFPLQMAAGIMGDPLSLLPLSFGLKGAVLASQAGRLSAAEIGAYGIKPVVYGALGGSVRTAMAQGALVIGQAAIQRGIDPALPIQDAGELLSIPVAIAASAGFVMGGFGRYRQVMDALHHGNLTPDYVGPTRAAGRKMPGEADLPAAEWVRPEKVPAGPAEVQAWQERAAANPEGRFALMGRVIGQEGKETLFETSKGVVVRLPDEVVDAASGSGAVMVPTKYLAERPELMGSAMSIDGVFVGGGRPAPSRVPMGDHLAPGALATNYGQVRAREVATDPLFSSVLRHTADFDQFLANNKLRGADGGPLMVYHGSGFIFRNFSNSELGKTTGSASSMEGHFFAGGPETAEHYAQQRFKAVRSFFGLGAVVGRKEVGAPNMRPSYIRMANPKIISDSEFAILDAKKYEELGRTKFDGDLNDKNGTTWKYDPESKNFIRLEAYIAEVGRQDIGKYSVGDVLPDKPVAPKATPNGTIMVEAAEAGEWSRLELRETADRSATIEVQSSKARNVDYAAEIRLAREAGHDGLVIHNTPDGGIGKDLRDSVYIVFDPEKQIRGFDQRYDIPQASGAGNLSAAASPGSAIFPGANPQAEDILRAKNRPVPTGIGLEYLPMDPWTRSSLSPSLTWQLLIEEMGSSGGRQRMKHLEGEASPIPVEQIIMQRWNLPMAQTLRQQSDLWIEYRKSLTGAVAGENSDIGRVAYDVAARVKDRFNKSNHGISFEEFRRRVGDAQIFGDVERHANDAATPFIQKAAAANRKYYDEIAREAQSVGLFEKGHAEQLEKAKASLSAVTKNPASTADEIKSAELKVAKLTENLDKLKKHGPQVNTAVSFRPRLWLVDRLIRDERKFKDIAEAHFRSKGETASEAAKGSHEVWLTLTRQRPIYERADVDEMFKDVANPGSTKSRTFDIPDERVMEFLENDSEVLIRSQMRQMGASIEIMRKFGSTGMDEQAQAISDEYGRLQAKIISDAKNAGLTPDAKALQDLRKRRELDLEDMQAVRDKLYGSYGAAADPHRWSSRTIRMAKQFTNVTVLGMAGVTALGDLIRPVMTEGLEAVYGHGLKTLMHESRAEILRMSRKELEAAGDAFEIINNVRAISASDGGDMFMSGSRFERGLNQTNSMFFVMNGLNAANQLDKEVAGVIIQGRVNALLVKAYKGGKLDPEDVTRLAVNGIDEILAKQLGERIDTVGKDFKSIRMANSEEWGDAYLREVYGTALNQMVNRTIPTPGVLDRPNWMSTEIGGLLSMYKGFVVGAMVRTTYSGLQEGGAKFWYGAAAAVGFSVILNELRSQWMYDKSTFDRPTTAVIADGIERASILGWFTDVNKTMEVLTGHTLGLRPMLGLEKPRYDSPSKVLGTLGGPAIGQGFNAMEVLGGFLQEHPTAKTWANARRLVPGQNLPYLDPIMDRTISDGSWHTQAPKRQKTKGKKEPESYFSASE